MLFKAIVLPSVLVPVAAALIAMLCASLWHRRQPQKTTTPLASGRGGGLALVLAFCAAYVAMNGWPRFPPVEATQRLLFFALLALPLALLLRGVAKPALLATVVFASLPLYYKVLESQIEYRWSSVESAAWIAGLSITNALVAAAWVRSMGCDTEPKLKQSPERRGTPLWAVGIRPFMLAIGALCLGLSGSALLGQLMGALAAAVATVEAWGYLSKTRPWSGSDAIVWTVTTCGLIVCGYFYAELSVAAGCLLIAALLLSGFNRGNASMPLRLCCLVPLLLAAGLVVAAELQQADEDTDDYDYYGQLEPIKLGNPQRA